MRVASRRLRAALEILKAAEDIRERIAARKATGAHLKHSVGVAMPW